MQRRSTNVLALAALLGVLAPRTPLADPARLPQRGRGPAQPVQPAPVAPPPGYFPLAIASSLTLDAPPAAPAGFDTTAVYIPLRTGQLEAVSSTTSRKVWSVAMATQSPPAAGDGLVFVASGDAVHALKPTDGAVKWTVPLGKPAPGGGPYCWAGSVLAANERGDLVLLEAQTGRKIWQQALGSPLCARPAVEQDRLFASLADGRVVALKIQTGEQVWQRKLGDAPGDPVVTRDRLYVGSLDKHFYALSPADGRVKWRWPTGADIVGRPVVIRDRVYFLSLDNQLRALDKGSGTQRWKTPLPARPSFGPLPLGDDFLVTGIAPTLYAFRLSDGVPAGSYAVPVDGDLVGPPFIQQGLVAADATFVIVTGNGELIALRSERSSVPPPAAPTPAPTPAAPAPPAPGRVRP